jgi:hypothetical protein
MNKLFIVSRYDEDYYWVENYTKDYLIYNKGEPIYNNPKIINTENVGGNQRDIAKFAFEHYGYLPDIMIFTQAFPFDHCTQNIFEKLIKNTEFTPLEYYGNTPANGWEQRDEFGGFKEINNSWFISAHNSTYNLTCKYNSFDEFMNKYFDNYNHLDFIRFAPGSQYLITPKEILQYPIKFWESLMNELTTKNSTEAHIIERSLYYILNGNYNLRKEFHG